LGAVRHREEGEGGGRRQKKPENEFQKKKNEYSVTAVVLNNQKVSRVGEKKGRTGGGRKPKLVKQRPIRRGLRKKNDANTPRTKKPCGLVAECWDEVAKQVSKLAGSGAQRKRRRGPEQGQMG